jgi:hypothetical protein
VDCVDRCCVVGAVGCGLLLGLGHRGGGRGVKNSNDNGRFFSSFLKRNR